MDEVWIPGAETALAVQTIRSASLVLENSPYLGIYTEMTLGSFKGVRRLTIRDYQSLRKFLHAADGPVASVLESSSGRPWPSSPLPSLLAFLSADAGLGGSGDLSSSYRRVAGLGVLAGGFRGITISPDAKGKQRRVRGLEGQYAWCDEGTGGAGL